MARSGGTYIFNPKTGREELVERSRTVMPTIAEQRAAAEAAEAATYTAPAAPPADAQPPEGQAKTNKPGKARQDKE